MTGKTDLALATFVAYPGLLGKRKQYNEKFMDNEGEFFVFKNEKEEECVSSRPRGNTNNAYEHRRFPFDP